MSSPAVHATSPVIEAILARRSIREEYESRPVPPEALDAILACGLAAPSSKNAQPWRFHVLQDRASLEKLARAAMTADGVEDWVPHDPRTGEAHKHWPSSVVESAEALLQVPCGILIENRGVFSGGRRVLAAAKPEAFATSLVGYAFECMGLGAALENIWLAANSLGLSVAYLGDLVIAEEVARDQFDLQGDLMGIIGVGYSNLTPYPRRQSPAETQTDTPVVWHGSDNG